MRGMCPMTIDEKDFFQQATLRICGSLEIEQAMMACFLFLKDFMPIDGMTMNRYDPALFAVPLCGQGECRRRAKDESDHPTAPNIWETA